MNTLTVNGVLTEKNPIENIENKEGKRWIKQTFLLDTGAEYNSSICFQLFGEDKVKLLEPYSKGDKIEVFFNLYSREYNGRYYHNIDAWKITSATIENTTSEDTPHSSENNLPF